MQSSKTLAAEKEATQPLYPTPQTPSSLAWDKVRDKSGVAMHPLRSGREAVRQG